MIGDRVARGDRASVEHGRVEQEVELEMRRRAVCRDREIELDGLTGQALGLTEIEIGGCQRGQGQQPEQRG